MSLSLFLLVFSVVFVVTHVPRSLAGVVVRFFASAALTRTSFQRIVPRIKTEDQCAQGAFAEHPVGLRHYAIILALFVRTPATA